MQQIEIILQDDTNDIALLLNCISALHFTFHFHWTGFYFVKRNKLELGIFQGPVACISISFGKGVCGTAWKENKTLIVDDVDQFEGHIACSSQTSTMAALTTRLPVAAHTLACTPSGLMASGRMM